ncbi:MAG TPA: ATPase, T2SS/T4P/T4SS family [Gemmatimonadales bacterium]|nr:ATPase, T2SS/T4P/T4SS family [Gemmatimonadales bacterium]
MTRTSRRAPAGPSSPGPLPIPAPGPEPAPTPPAGAAEPPRTSADLRAAAAGPLAQRLSSKYLEEHCLLPLAVAPSGELVVAAGAPLDPTVIDELCWTFERRVRLVEAPAAEIHAAVLSAQSEAAPDVQATDLRGGDLVVLTDEEETIDDLRALANQAPVIKLVNLLILEALRARSSDIHLEAGADGLRVRYRIDGVLQDVSHPPRQYQAAVISRIKIMAGLNIAERRLAQDGRIRLRLSDRELDLRVSITPTLHGEGVVLRILDRGAGVRDLTELGMPGRVLEDFERLIRQPHGIILVTGPTGSGKTTTLYGALDRLNGPGVKIVTVEDPVEYQVEGITQIPVNPKIGLTFAAALRSILRHDPDIIMVGEMRDRETAEIAIQAALTGHLVFSTLHTNDAPSGVTRMVDMGIEPYLVAATVLGILGQRLVRVVCDSCAEDFRPPPDVVAQAAAGQPDIPKPRFRRGRAGGCEACSGTGYRGRTGLYELMRMSDELRARVVKNAPLAEIQALAQARGMAPLRAAGWAKACAGGTTLEEVLRVTRDEVLG